MAQTPSSFSLELGSPMPVFALPDAVGGGEVTHESLRGAPAALVMFICNHCPYVVHVRGAIGALERDYTPRGVRLVGINANSLRTHPQDGPGPMRELARELGWGFPFLFDETQEVAKAFGAACTPDFYVFDGGGRLAYHGQLDESRPGRGGAPTGRDVRAALDAVLAGRAPEAAQKASIGCGIKWHPGREPAYL
ncbi:MAG TPA: thioredoxin family protein [Polyangiaceae bacterium]|nr:thioredoxin family protein [Polyangiaceae bacterium]